jgi:demethylmenaquinone methyltransferase/2-methoxy-6-polyprenyl-1,4-benzoquinol methylase
MEDKREAEDVQAFNLRSATYETSIRQWLFFDRVQKTVLDLANCDSEPESILDVGCGTGRLLRKAKERWPNVRLLGIDPADGMVEKARQMVPDATFYVGMAEALPLPDASLDFVVSTPSFNHWQDQEKGVQEIARVLRPNGKFVIADIVMPLVLSKVIRHFRRNNPEKTKRIFMQAGLDVETQRRRMARFLFVTVGKNTKT